MKLLELKTIITLAVILFMNTYLFAAPPPPPSVPLDAGLSLLVVAAVGYAGNKIIKKNQM